MLDYPDITVMNLSPALLKRWGLKSYHRRLQVPVTHLIPAAIMGSGLGKNTAWRGDYDIQLFDPQIRRRYRLDSLRFGDLVAIAQEDTRLGPAYRSGKVTIGIIVHGDSTVSGHGPGVAPLLTSSIKRLEPISDPQANIAGIFNLRSLPPYRSDSPLAGRQRPPVRARQRKKTPAYQDSRQPYPPHF